MALPMMMLYSFHFAVEGSFDGDDVVDISADDEVKDDSVVEVFDGGDDV